MKISNANELEARIIELQKRKVIQESLLVSQFHSTVESLKPVNMLKSTLSKISHTPDLRNDILKGVAGLGLGILTKKLFIGQTTSLLSKLLGTGLELGMAKTAINQTDKLRAYGIAIYHNLFRKNHKPV